MWGAMCKIPACRLLDSSLGGCCGWGCVRGEDAAPDGWLGNVIAARNFPLFRNLIVDAQQLKTVLLGNSHSAWIPGKKPPLLCCSRTFNAVTGLVKRVELCRCQHHGKPCVDQAFAGAAVAAPLTSKRDSQGSGHVKCMLRMSRYW